MVGPVVYEASVPFILKALSNQVQILKRGDEWCKENGHDASKLTKAKLGEDMFALPFHVHFCTYNAVQLLIDLKVVDMESLPIAEDDQPMEELIARLEQTLTIFEQATPEKFAGKENDEIDVFLGRFSVKRSAMTYVHEISLPSFWFHHSMVYSILRAQGVPLTKQLYLSAW